MLRCVESSAGYLLVAEFFAPVKFRALPILLALVVHVSGDRQRENGLRLVDRQPQIVVGFPKL